MLSSGGVLNLNTAATIDASSTLSIAFNGGILNTLGGTYRVGSGQGIGGFGTLNSSFLGLQGSAINVASGSLSVGAQASNGFATDGNVSVGSGATLLTKDSDFARFGGAVVLSGGTIGNSSSSTFSGITFSTGSTLTGSGNLDARVTADIGSSISASGGNLTIGNVSKLSFFSAGDLHTGDNTVTLLGSNRATLGSLTTLGSASSGTLNVDRGAFVDFGRTIVGYGTVHSVNSLGNAMIINGDVIGNSSSNRITFDGYVKGLGTFTNVTMNGTYSPGLSPSIVATNNLGLGSASVLEMEIGGLLPGTEHDQITDSGELHLDGILKLVLINGYAPTNGAQFDLFNWNVLTGSFSGFDFSQAVLADGLQWDLGQLYLNGSIRIVSVPEPSTSLMCMLGIFVGLSLRARAIPRNPKTTLA